MKSLIDSCLDGITSIVPRSQNVVIGKPPKVEKMISEILVRQNTTIYVYKVPLVLVYKILIPHILPEKVELILIPHFFIQLSTGGFIRIK